MLGPLQKTLTYELPSGADLIVVNFTLNGFYRLGQVPMHQFSAGDVYDPDVLLNKSCFDELWGQLASMTKLDGRLQRLNDYALAFAAPIDASAIPLLDSMTHFRKIAVEPVKGVAHAHQLSVRSVQLRFQTQLGYSAKELVRFLRFKKPLTSLCQQSSAPVDWLELVNRFGYHDHSHLIKDFHYFLAGTPR